MSTTTKLNTEAFEQAVEQYPSLAAMCNHLQELKSLREENSHLKKSCVILAEEHCQSLRTATSLKKIIAKMHRLCVATLAPLVVGYFYTELLSGMVGVILLFYCGATIAVIVPKVCKAYSNLLTKLETLLNR